MKIPDSPANIFHNVSITDLAINGMGIARIEGMVVFVRNTVPGDEVDIRFISKRRKYVEAIPVQFNILSIDRSDPGCLHFGTCGGCTIRNIQYPVQLKLKQKMVNDVFNRIGHMQDFNMFDIIPSPKTDYYKNKLEFSFSEKRWLTEEEISSGEIINDKNALGFHYPGRFDRIVDIKDCLMQPAPSNQIRLFIRDYAEKNKLTFNNPYKSQGLLRSLIIRTSNNGETMVVLVFGQEPEEEGLELLKATMENFKNVRSFWYMVNTKKNDSTFDLPPIHYAGEKFLVENLEQLKLLVGPKSFYQTNSEQTLNLYSVVREFANINRDSVVFDLYSGTGSIGLFLSKDAKKVIGIESMMESVKEAELNKEYNHILNAEFHNGLVENLFRQELFEKEGLPNVVIFDPPRAGLHKNAIDVVNEKKPGRIIYVSCNPSTQARDIEMLGINYHLSAMQPLDMFPHTFHIENVALLTLK